MRFLTFHYMSYKGVENVDETVNAHDAAWVNLPNSICDPAIAASNYADYIDQAALADELGFDGVTVNEHHQTPFGIPTPNIMAAAISQRTKRCRIAVFGNGLPLRKTPLVSLEEYTMIDLLSKGRLEAGFVVGGGPEYYNFSMSPTEARDMFAEGLALVRRAWSEPGPFRWDGEYYQLETVNPWPVSLQRPHPPIWVCGVGSPTTLEMCARENLGYMGVNLHAGLRDFAQQCDYFREQAVVHGREYDPAKIGWLCHIHVADDDETANEEFNSALHYGHTLARGFGGPFKTFFPPGHLPPDKLAAWEANMHAMITNPQNPTAELNLVGSAETVAQRLLDRIKDFKIGNVAMAFQWGSMPHETVTRSMRMFAEQVMPIVRREADAYLDDLYPNRTQSQLRSEGAVL